MIVCRQYLWLINSMSNKVQKMEQTAQELLNQKGRKFYSFTTACLSLVDESNRINEILRENNNQVENISEADFIVVTTCAVSKDSAQNSVDNIIHLNKTSGNKPIYVGGCLSNANEKKQLDGWKNISFFTADNIFKAVDKVNISCKKTTSRCSPFWLKNMSKKRNHLQKLQKKHQKLAELYAFTTDGIVFQDMPFEFDTIRLSKGCSKRCTYCAIPHNRGKYIEHDLDYIRNQIKSSRNKHILLIGENIGCHKDFDKIMEYAINNGKILMLRYLEPEYINRIKKEYLEHISYIGVPLQSGSNKVLRDMRRPRNLAAVKQKLREWSKSEIFLGTSMILSYPTESIIDYLKSLWFIATAPVNYVSFQNFSPRENSPAFEQYREWDSNSIMDSIKYGLFDYLVNLKGRINYLKTMLWRYNKNVN